MSAYLVSDDITFSYYFKLKSRSTTINHLLKVESEFSCRYVSKQIYFYKNHYGNRKNGNI